MLTITVMIVVPQAALQLQRGCQLMALNARAAAAVHGIHAGGGRKGSQSNDLGDLIAAHGTHGVSRQCHTEQSLFN
jgi:hypothetical protein